MAFEKGNYDNCKLKSAQFGSGEYGDQWALKFNIADSGQERTVYLSCGEDRTDKDGKTDLQKTTETMIRLGWNRNFDNPEFNPEVTDPGIQLFMSPSNTTGKERWYVSTGGGGITLKPPTTDGRNKFMTAFKANAGATKPAGSRPPAAPGKAPPKAPAAPAKRVASTRDEAWNYAVKENTKCDEAWFLKSVADHAEKCGRDDDNFTASDWNTVATEAALPF